MRLLSIVCQFALALGLVVFLLLGSAVFARHHIFRLRFGLPAYSHQLGEVRELRIPTRDGVLLTTQVILPEGEGPWPVVVIRNPYNILNAFTFFCEVFARYGYACVHQDVRGRMGSEGEWSPLIHEREDGLDLFAWLKEQSFQNGRWGLWGMSYLAGVQWTLADELPDEVQTLVSMVFGVDAYRVMYQRGLFRHDVFSAWAALMPRKYLELWNGPAYQRFIRHRPHRSADEAELGVGLKWYRSWLDSPRSSDPLWSEPPFIFFRDSPRRVAVPVMMIGGYFDPFFDAQWRDFERLSTRKESKLILGPWHHLQTGAADFPLREDLGLGGQWRLVLDWLGHHLKEEPIEQAVGVVEVYDVGAGGWRRRPSFPPAATTKLRLHLSCLQSSATIHGGKLEPEPPLRSETPVSYLYDPTDPTPSTGGSATLTFAFGTFPSIEPGAREGLPLGTRADILSFVSAPLAQPFHLAGSPKVFLRVSSDAEDTAFGFELLVSPPEDSRWFHIRQGYGTLSFRSGTTATVSYLPKTVVGLGLDAWPIEWTFPVGSQLRVDIRSSSFPLYSAHPNVAGPWAKVGETKVAEQRLHPGSWLDLPVVEDPEPVLSASALGRVLVEMACTFTIDLSRSPEDIVEKAKQMIEENGGSFAGDVIKGGYRVKLPIGSVEGNYTIEGSSIRFDITKKPMLVPCGAIESFLRDRLKS